MVGKAQIHPFAVSLVFLSVPPRLRGVRHPLALKIEIARYPLRSTRPPTPATTGTCWAGARMVWCTPAMLAVCRPIS